MKWSRFSAWAELSDCHRYSVSAAQTAEGFKFDAWRWAGKGEMQIRLGSFDDAARARECCEIDAKEREVA